MNFFIILASISFGSKVSSVKTSYNAKFEYSKYFFMELVFSCQFLYPCLKN